MSFTPWSPPPLGSEPSGIATGDKSANAQTPQRRLFGTWLNYLRRAASALQDTLHTGRHSRDFNLARADHLRHRVLICGTLFALLTPLWLLVDRMLLPGAMLAFVMPGRFFLLGGLIATLYLAYRANGNPERARWAAGLLIALPAAFYGLMLLSLPTGQTHQLIGYSFIPYLLVATLCIFPLTMMETFVAGMAMVLLECIAQQQAGIWLSAAGWQGLWLLSVLVVIALVANHFHLGLLMRLYRQARRDTLTGLLNRRTLHQTLCQLRRHSPEKPIGLILVDIDHIKEINDEHGHTFGDRVLEQVAAQLEELAQAQGGLATRYAGEEFLLMLPDVAHTELTRLAQGICQQVPTVRLVNYDGQRVPMTVSIGVATLHPSETFEQALQQASTRLERAKADGCNQVIAT